MRVTTSGDEAYDISFASNDPEEPMKAQHALATLVVAISLSLSTAAQTRELRALPDPELFRHRVDGGLHVVEMTANGATCRTGRPEETPRMMIPREELHVIYGGRERDRVSVNGVESQATGMKITLRATQQLENFPAAKQAFIRAAQVWESRIANPISVFIDVDYGPTRFGEPYPSEHVIGSTQSDLRGSGAGTYEDIRALVVAKANNPLETAAYAQLPTGTLPTDLGSTDEAIAPSILLRALGGLPATAASEDDAPNIGFNSQFAFDLDPSNGIDAGKMDFEAVTVHEIGHALGFGSSVGLKDLDPTLGILPSVFDFFRFRPGVSMGTFRTAQRPLSVGGSHVYFAGAPALALSTGGPDGTGGDEQQASHWKDDDLTGTYIGLMDPNIATGTRGQLTQNDLDAFGMMGYDIVSSNGCSESEPNQTAAQATALQLPGSCGGSVAADTNPSSSPYSVTYQNGTTDRIEDVWSVFLPTAAKLSVTLTFTTGSADLDLFLFSVSGSQLTILDNASGSTTTETFTTDNNLPAGTYYIGVSAYQGSSPYTLSVNSIGAAPQTPTAPSNLTATATSSTVIRLNWVDNASNETEFRVEQKVGGSFQDLGAVDANATTVNITGVAPGTTQTFRVRAKNAAGFSGYSNEATATTPGNTTGPCVANATTMCLMNNRFRVSIDYKNPYSNPPGQPGTFVGQRLNPSVPNPDTAIFGFAKPTDVEVVVRIVDARPYAPRFDVYYGGLTDVEYWVNVTDTQTGRTKQYYNKTGNVGGGVDRATFPAP